MDLSPYKMASDVGGAKTVSDSSENTLTKNMRKKMGGRKTAESSQQITTKN